ncbi:hypothetical protein [Nocardia sp. NPDC048505]|uniref:hypothetical protein n=1 Tax=unclassified Nocardia TaxID=2637762 RepID=UPI003401CB73
MSGEDRDDLDAELSDLDWADIDPTGLRTRPTPAFETMSNAELSALALAGSPHTGSAAFALIDRAPHDDTAARAAGDIAKMPSAQSDRFNRISLTWSIIAGLLATQTPVARACAYEAFEVLPAAEQAEVLDWLQAPDIRSAHPTN